MHTERTGNSRVGCIPKTLGTALDKHPMLFILSLSFLLTLLTEILGRHSLWNGIMFVLSQPLHFASCMTIVMATLSLGLFFKKRAFAITFFSAVWLGLGITNSIVLLFRIAPFGFIDITLLPSISTIFTVYMKPWQIILIIAVILSAAAFLVFFYLKTPKHIPNIRAAFLVLLISAAAAIAFYGSTVVGHRDERSKTLSNIRDAYSEYGFVYCFCTGAFDHGISEPGFYSRDNVGRLMSRLKKASEPELRPNIIMVQLESFFDVAYLDDVTCEENPIPVFTELKNSCSSGFLTVPSIGAGTANTEFEVLSGMSLDFFGLGEYPYNTILQEESCETVAADLKAIGYTAHAVHNNSGVFYDRDTVFAQLGFDYFIPIEFMEHVEYNPIGWAKDKVLTEEIMKALDSTHGRDFVFTITVQGHGKYQLGAETVDAESEEVTWDENEEYADDLAYYLSQLRDTDEFIGELIAALERRAEPTVLVLYGDHLPNLNILSEELTNHNLFATEYVIWNNLGLPKEDKDLSAFQLTAEVMRRLGIGGGILSRYHQQMSGKAGYNDGLRLLEYDMLYGKFYCYGGKNPYKASNLQMGITPIVISNALWEDEQLIIKGSHFTPFSCITVDGDELDTDFVGSSSLTAKLKSPPKIGAVITVRQESASSETLYESVGLKFRDR